MLQEWGVPIEKAHEVALKYFHARGVQIQKETIMDQTQEQLTELQNQLAAMQEQLAAKAEAEAEAKAKAEQLTVALDASNERIARMESDAKRTRFRAMAEGWHGDAEKHVDVLASLADDEQLFGFYVQQQNAVAEQLKDSALFRELGTDREPTGGTATEQLHAIASKLATDEKLSFAQAIQAAAERNPQLYIEHVNAQRGK
jgi:Tfp pilus assembly protein FimV